VSVSRGNDEDSSVDDMQILLPSKSIRMNFRGSLMCAMDYAVVKQSTTTEMASLKYAPTKNARFSPFHLCRFFEARL